MAQVVAGRRKPVIFHMNWCVVVSLYICLYMCVDVCVDVGRGEEVCVFFAFHKRGKTRTRTYTHISHKIHIL